MLAASDSASPEGARALEKLCQTYWRPIYCYIRGKGYSIEDAEDLTQAFFAHLLERDALKTIDREKERISLSRKDTLSDPWDLALTNAPACGQDRSVKSAWPDADSVVSIEGSHVGDRADSNQIKV